MLQVLIFESFAVAVVEAFRPVAVQSRYRRRRPRRILLPTLSPGRTTTSITPSSSPTTMTYPPRRVPRATSAFALFLNGNEDQSHEEAIEADDDEDDAVRTSRIVFVDDNNRDDDDFPDEVWDELQENQPSEWMVMKEVRYNT